MLVQRNTKMEPKKSQLSLAKGVRKAKPFDG
jgi:hypothetical protein